MAKKITRTDVSATASSEEANVFVTALQEKFQRKKRTPEERQRLRKYLAQYSRGYLRSIASGADRHHEGAGPDPGPWRQAKARSAPQGQARRTLAPQIREAVSARALLTRHLFGQILGPTDDGESSWRIDVEPGRECGPGVQPVLSPLPRLEETS